MFFCRKFLFVGILTSTFIFSISGLVAEDGIDKGSKAKIFIGKLEIEPSVIDSAAKNEKALSLNSTAQSLNTQLISALSATGIFQIVERRRYSDLQEEQSFASTNVDENDAQAAQQGKMSGAKYVLLPQIDGFEDMVDVQEYKDIQRFSMRRKLYLSVTVTIVDTTTGEYLSDVANVQMNKQEIVENAQNKKFIQGSNALNVDLAKSMANTLCMEIVNAIRPAKILAVTGKQVMINRGSTGGFIKGVPVEFYAFEEVADDDTGETFRNEVFVGKGTIIRSVQKQSYASIEGQDLGIAKGCIVKILSAGAASIGNVPLSAPGGSLPEDPRRVPAEPAPMTPGSSEKPLSFGTDKIITVSGDGDVNAEQTQTEESSSADGKIQSNKQTQESNNQEE